VISREEADGRFGFIGQFVGLDMPTSSAITRELLRWEPTGPPPSSKTSRPARTPTAPRSEAQPRPEGAVRGRARPGRLEASRRVLRHASDRSVPDALSFLDTPPRTTVSGLTWRGSRASESPTDQSAPCGRHSAARHTPGCA
jgi:hypothetical protein